MSNYIESKCEERWRSESTPVFSREVVGFPTRLIPTRLLNTFTQNILFFRCEPGSALTILRNRWLFERMYEKEWMNKWMTENLKDIDSSEFSTSTEARYGKNRMFSKYFYHFKNILNVAQVTPNESNMKSLPSHIVCFWWGSVSKL